MAIDINGVAHIALVVGEWDRSRPFYRALLPFLGLVPVFDGDEGMYFVGGRTAIGIQRLARQPARFDQGTVGLHHLCLRARSRDDVDAVHAFVRTLAVPVVRAPSEGGWAPGYYSTLFEDPSGIRIEINHVPGRGVLGDDASFDPGSDYR